VLLLFTILALWSAYKVLQRHTRIYKGAGYAVVMSIVWAAIHSISDFNLQIPANALTFVVVLSLAFSCRGLRGGGGGAVEGPAPGSARSAMVGKSRK